MQPKFTSLTQAFVVAAGLALAPIAAFAQTAPAAKPADKPVAAPQTAEAACAVHKKDSKEFKDCVDKSKTMAKPSAKDPGKKS